jgi:hypothetical protein
MQPSQQSAENRPNATPNQAGELAPNWNIPAGGNLAPKLPEVAPLGQPEQARNAEISRGDARSLALPTAQPVQAFQPTAAQTVQSDDKTTTTTATPTTAADDDLIEKEWVAKAQQTIKATRDDPHRQADEIAKLMVDYVHKRYGKEVGKADDE